MAISSLDHIHPAAMISMGQSAHIAHQVLHGTFKAGEIHPASIPDVNLVTDGYGELVLRVKEGDSFRPVTKEEYIQAYKIFQKYAPRLEREPRPLAKSRIEMMREELRTINPDMVGTFIPRTLHDLIFIRKYIDADIEKARQLPKVTLSSNNNSWTTGVFAKSQAIVEYREIFGSSSILIQGPKDPEIYDIRLHEIGFRLNTAACEILEREARHATDLRRDQIDRLVEEQIQFLKNYQSHSPFPHGSTVLISGISSSFLKHLVGEGRPMAIDSEQAAQIIRNAASLECQKSSIGKVIAYRGGDLRTDTPLRDKVMPYCMSFGSGLFSGVINDPGACAFPYARVRPDAYAFVLDPSKDSSVYFFTPAFTALESLFGDGEAWHYRYKIAWDEKEVLGVDGVIGLPYLSGDPRNLEIFKSFLSRDELVGKYEDLKKHNLVILKSEIRA